MTDQESSIEVENLKFTYGPGYPEVLHGVAFDLPPGSRCLITGTNGTGKTTLLRILSGKHYIPKGKIQVCQDNVFDKTPPGLSYLGGEWATNPTVRKDVVVRDLCRSVGGDNHPERRDKLIELLDINLDWHMNRVSDGERRRVQIMLSLIYPFTALLLDEVTVDLDILARQDLLLYLKEETEKRKATIMYATHIFDGLAYWPTHILHLSNGTLKRFGPIEQFKSEMESLDNDGDGVYKNSQLLKLIEKWLRIEWKEKLELRKKMAAEPQPVPEIEKMANDRKYGDRFYNYWTAS